MNQTCNRRRFMGAAAGLLGASPLLFGAYAHAEGQKNANHLIACRDAHLKETGAPDAWSAAQQIGVSGLEIWVNEDLTCPYLFHPEKKYSIRPEEMGALKDALKAHNLAATSFCMPNQFDRRPEFELEWAKNVVRACRETGAKAIRIDVVPGKIEDPKEFLAFAIRMGKDLVKLVEGTEIRFGIENHGGTTNNPEFLDPLFQGVGSDALGLTLDTANFYWYGHPLEKLYGIFEKYASRACHTHCKSIAYPEDKRNAERPRGWEYGKYASPIYEGDIDFKRVFSILEKAGYQGDFCIEDESLSRFPEGERGEVLKKEADYLKTITG